MAKKKAAKTSLLSKAKSAGSSLVSKVTGAKGSKGSKGGKRRGKSVQYWANKVIKAKLKKKYYRIVYGSV